MPFGLSRLWSVTNRSSAWTNAWPRDAAAYGETRRAMIERGQQRVAARNAAAELGVAARNAAAELEALIEAREAAEAQEQRELRRLADIWPARTPVWPGYDDADPAHFGTGPI